MAGGALDIRIVHQDIDPVMAFDTPEELFSARAEKFSRHTYGAAADPHPDPRGRPCKHIYITKKGSAAEFWLEFGETEMSGTHSETAIIRAPEDPGEKVEIDREILKYIGWHAAGKRGAAGLQNFIRTRPDPMGRPVIPPVRGCPSPAR
jgi:hypothetical protein